MDYDNLQLRSKTFLDFTDDPAVLDEIIGGHSKADKEAFLSAFVPENGSRELERAMTFMAFTDFCKDEKLVEAITFEFEEEYRSVFNE